jgi:prophage antirepressor-like protein
MSGLQTFNYGTNNVRTVQQDGELWFVLKDICAILGLGNPSAVASKLDDDERNILILSDTIRGNPNFIGVNESGLYTTILRCNKPDAKTFRKWLTSEVLPSIRKNGIYATETTIDSMIADPEFAIKLLTNLKEEKDKRKALEAENAYQKHKLIEAKPKLEFVDNVLECDDTVNITQIAKDYGMSGKALNQILKDLKVQYKLNGQWLLCSEHQNCGYTRSRTSCSKTKDGKRHSYMHTRWTQKGRMFVYEILKSVGILPLSERGE